MGHWGFVFLAYGIVWCSILIYTMLLKRRIQRATAARGKTPPAASEADGHEA